jgi:hypothetical protein
MNWKLFRNIFYLVLFTFSAKAQLHLSVPANRQVYQRNKQNTATVYVGGSFSGQFERIEARTTLLDGQGNPKVPLQQSSWQIVASNPTGGTFVGSLANVKGGWYRLEVRAIQNEQPVGDVNTIKVGVGEVFAIAGQSNARGDVPINNPTLFGATDDRVNSVDLNDFSVTATPKYPEFVHLDARTRIAPTGGCSWVWAPMGDLLAKNWDVPVLFFNAAVGNTSVFDWRAGANQENSAHAGGDHRTGWPFVYLKNTLNYYCSLTGIRAVLWHQGENDTGNFEGAQLDPVIYRDNMIQIINKSRSISDKNLSWVIAKASRNGGGTSWRVLLGQQFTIDLPSFNVFAGPSTDEIQPSVQLRDVGGAHFMGTGIQDVGFAWYNSINTSQFINNSVPSAALAPLNFRASACQNNNQVTFTMPEGNTEYKWFTDNYTNLEVGQNYTATNKKNFVAYMRDANQKNYLFTPPVNFIANELSLITDKDPKICAGQNLVALANTFNNNYLWNNGATSKTVKIETEGDYDLSVKSKSVFGCENTATKFFTMKVNPLPATPVIESEGSPSICFGSSVNLKANNNFSNVSYIWSSGSTAPVFNTNQSGSYTLVVKDNNNCFSETSNQITVQVNPIPSRPEIQSGGSTTFCEGKTLTLAVTEGNSYEWYRNGQKIENFVSQFVFVTLPGSYRGKVFNVFGCGSSPSDAIEVKNYPLPPAPNITTDKSTVFCAGGNVSLSASSNLSNLRWYKNGGLFESNPTISVVTDAKDKNADHNYYATVTDQLGCESLPSETVKVAIRANPSVTFVDQSGTFSLRANAPILGLAGSSYEWYRNGQIIEGNSSYLKTNQSGSYHSVSKIEYNIPNIGTLVCKSGVSNKYSLDVPYSEIFTVFDNPSHTGLFKIEAKDNFDFVKITLLTAMGQVIFKKTIDTFTDTKTLNLSNLPNGIYKLYFEANSTQVVKTLIIDK